MGHSVQENVREERWQADKMEICEYGATGQGADGRCAQQPASRMAHGQQEEGGESPAPRAAFWRKIWQIGTHGRQP